MKVLRLSPALLLVFVLAASCPKHPENFEPNSVDSARSARLTADAWLAPAKAYHASYNGLNNISRESVVRTASFTHGDPLDVVTRETRKALQNGWVLTYVHCGSVARPMSSASAPQTLPGVEVNLEKSSADPENAAMAQLTAYRVEPDPDGQGTVNMEINAFAQYHSDRGWPNLPGVAMDTTCLVIPGAPSAGSNTTSAFPSGIVQGVKGGHPLNEKGEPDGSAG
ncbi:hypothetical protein [Mycobacteroides chelonae]|uniref:Lipoprotein n=2 Tax=Mycobacteroides chelonae TaxID=1774 RepID=A0A1S1KBN2_MYCCH|nr:hypothetical protein [Mycobacteroides chelonae]MBF9329628.1 hypothetical protein [Mycobacteroides chelonae]MBF9423905.1 hypothetical protein [Mycobacteroides chelonae]MBF9437509.1 hypothetical protein [Mycobacteroides chelonae]MBV6358806.1 hypothetical protein [Mycobacteroides chelonae]MEC4835568.1 hypothetical protein [Mycobacteroides chelonae]